MIRAVLDVNVLASGSLKAPTPPGLLLDIWQAGSFRLIISEHILTNLQRALAKTYFRRRLTAAETNAFLALLRQEAILAPITASVQGVAPDAEDDLVLATAMSGQVDYLVTGDAAFRDLLTYRGIRIVSPRAFLEILTSPSPRPDPHDD